MNILYIVCNNTKEDYYKAFISIKQLENKKISKNNKWISDHCVVYQIEENVNPIYFVNFNSIKEHYKPSLIDINAFDISDSKIVLVLRENDYDETFDDVYNYKYFILLQKSCLEIENRYVYIDCSESYKYKIASYINFNYFDYKNVFCSGKNNSVTTLPKKFSISYEWIPTMYIDKTVLEILRNSYNFLDIFKIEINLDKQKKIDFIDLFSRYKNEDKRLLYLKVCIHVWINEHKELCKLVENENILEKLNYLPLITLLLFLLQFMKYGQKTYKLEEIKKLIDVSSDYGEGLIQLAENSLYHSNGGVLSVRLNDNKNKLNIETGDNCWFLRMSVCDFSTSSIVLNLKAKTKINNLELRDVFFDSKKEDYLNYLNKADNIIHHYGLMTFSQIVKKNHGCFVVFSAKGSKKSSETYYCAKQTDIIEKELDIYKIENNHIPGTDYDILLPILPLNVVDGKNISLPVNQILDRKKLTKEEYCSICDFFDFFVSNDIEDFSFDSFQNSNRVIGYNEQKNKEHIINATVENLYNKIKEIIMLDSQIKYKNYVLYFNLSNCKSKRIEAVAKIIMGIIIKFSNKKTFNINFILQDLNENTLLSFVRQFALFYRNGINDYMDKSQVYLQSDDGIVDVQLFSKQLRTVYEYNLLMQLEHGFSSEITDRLNHIAQRMDKNEIRYDKYINNAICFESLPKCDYDSDNKPCIENGYALFYKKLLQIVSNDIHDNGLGCKICNSHIRANKVHLSDFFEAQILFGNVYWCSHFVDYIVSEIEKDERIDKSKQLILYSYENYAEPMAYLAHDILKSKGYLCEYIIYENSKYITSSEKSDIKIRYIDKLIDKENTNMQIISIIGISTTLSTLETMKTNLMENIKSINEDAFVSNYIVFQLINKKEKYSNIEFDELSKIIKLKAKNKNCKRDIVAKYFCQIESNWSKPENCILCFPEEANGSYLDEEYLISTNETSTVPMLLIKQKNKLEKSAKNPEVDSKFFTNQFLNNDDNKTFLYYFHIDRGGNHHQFYIRTAELLTSELDNYDINERIGKWFEQIKQTLNSNSGEKINILVCPAHFSNEAFATAVNQYVFGGNAYMINFDVRKEFRDTFEVKYSNYASVLKMISETNLKNEVEICFHFVDDQIVTGDTFFRAKSLVSGFMRNIDNEKTPSIFESIITLIDRNSNSSRQNYFSRNQEVRFYSYLRFNTPSIRSYGDSCPLCRKITDAKILSQDSSLTFVSEYWHNKSKQHALIPLTKAKKHKNYNDAEKTLKEFSRLKTSEYIWSNIDDVDSKEYLADKIIYKYISNLNSDKEKIEYIISFYKICSREHLIFQENINNYIFKMLLDTFSLFTDNPTNHRNDVELYNYIYSLITNKENFENDEIKGIIFDLYCIIITRLCALGSNFLLHEDRLIDCYNIGEKWFSKKSYNQKESIILPKGNKDLGVSIPIFMKLTFAEFLSIQIKNYLHVTDSSNMKIRKLNVILEKELRKYDEQFSG